MDAVEQLPAELEFMDLLPESTERLLMNYTRSQDKLSGFDKYFAAMCATPSGDRTTPAEEYSHYWHKALFERNGAFRALTEYLVELEQHAEQSAAFQKRAEYLEAALSIVATLTKEGTTYSDDMKWLRREMYKLSTDAMHGRWTRE